MNFFICRFFNFYLRYAREDAKKVYTYIYRCTRNICYYHYLSRHIDLKLTVGIINWYIYNMQTPSVCAVCEWKRRHFPAVASCDVRGNIVCISNVTHIPSPHFTFYHHYTCVLLFFFSLHSILSARVPPRADVDLLDFTPRNHHDISFCLYFIFSLRSLDVLSMTLCAL